MHLDRSNGDNEDTSPRFTVGVALNAHVRSLQLITRDAALRRAVGTTLVLNALLFTLLAAAGLWAGYAAAGALARGLGLPESSAWIGALVAGLGLALVTPQLAGLLATLASLPLRERIFRRTRVLCGAPEVRTPGGFGALWRIARTELRRLLGTALLAVLLLPIHFLPVVGTLLYAATTLAVASYNTAWDLLSFHFELHDWDYERQRRWLRTHLPTSLVFGAIAFVSSLVPLAQFYFLSTQVVAAGLVSARLDGGDCPDAS